MRNLVPHLPNNLFPAPYKSRESPLIRSLTDLHAAIFDLTPEAAYPSAIDRARCTDTVDEITGHRSTNIEADWQLAEDYLRTAYHSIAQAI